MKWRRWKQLWGPTWTSAIIPLCLSEKWKQSTLHLYPCSDCTDQCNTADFSTNWKLWSIWKEQGDIGQDFQFIGWTNMIIPLPPEGAFFEKIWYWYKVRPLRSYLYDKGYGAFCYVLTCSGIEDSDQARPNQVTTWDGNGSASLVEPTTTKIQVSHLPAPGRFQTLYIMLPLSRVLCF